MQAFKNLIVPLVAIVVLVLGNTYQGLSDSTLKELETSLVVLGGAIAGVISAVALVLKEKKANKGDNINK